jgi:hypothetical protein
MPAARDQRDRTLELLFALIEDRPHRDLIRRSYGLCLRNLCRALALAPPAPIWSTLCEIQQARLARLQWELEEASRKSAWQYRTEAPGIEITAWRRALLRFSGSFLAED